MFANEYAFWAELNILLLCCACSCPRSYPWCCSMRRTSAQHVTSAAFCRSAQQLGVQRSSPGDTAAATFVPQQIQSKFVALPLGCPSILG